MVNVMFWKLFIQIFADSVRCVMLQYCNLNNFTVVLNELMGIGHVTERLQVTIEKNKVLIVKLSDQIKVNEMGRGG